METSHLIDPSLWSASGGLIGLVIFALFLELALFVWAQAKIYDMHRSDLKMLIEMHAHERLQWGQQIDFRQKESNECIKALTVAITENNNRSRRYEQSS